MASWSQTFSVNNKYSLTLECSEQSYSVANNTSVVAYKLTMATAAASFTGYSDYKTTISVSINGSSVYSYSAARDFNAAAASSYSEVLTSGTVTVSHNNDGSKTCACAASVTVASGPYSPGSASISQNLALTTIPRASTASWSGDFVIGTAKSITITRASSSFTHRLVFALGSRTETPTSSAGTSYTWTPTAANWAAQFPTQTSRTGTLTLYTYNGSTLVGSNAYSFTLKIPDTWKPSVSLSLSPSSSNTFISGTGLYVAGYTAIAAAASATAATGAAIASYTFSGAMSKTVTTSDASTAQTSGVIATSGSKTVTVTVTDARGRTGTASASCSFVSYAFPAVTSLSYARGTYSGGTWTASDTGEDLRIVFSASCSLSGNGNTMTYSAPVMSATGSNTSGQSVTLYRTGIGTVTTYTVTATVTDSVGNSSSRSVFVPTLEIPFVLDPNLPAVGVGAVPQTTRTLELASNWAIKPGGGILGQPDGGANTPTRQGYHQVPLPTFRASYLGVSTTPDFLLAVLKRVCQAYPGRVYCLYSGSAIVNTGGFLSLMIYDTSATDSNGYPQYAVGEYISYGGAGAWRYSFGSVNYVPYVHNDTVFTTERSYTFNVTAGTIGTRGGYTSWTLTSGTPLFAMVVGYSSSNYGPPMVLLDGNTIWLVQYRSVSTAFTQNCTVRIFYTPS